MSSRSRHTLRTLVGALSASGVTYRQDASWIDETDDLRPGAGNVFILSRPGARDAYVIVEDEEVELEGSVIRCACEDLGLGPATLGYFDWPPGW